MRLLLVALLVCVLVACCSACGGGKDGYTWEPKNNACMKDGRSVGYKPCAERHLIPGS